MKPVFGVLVKVLPEPALAELIERLRRTRPDAFEVGAGKGEANMVIDERRGIIYVTETGMHDLRAAIENDVAT